MGDLEFIMPGGDAIRMTDQGRQYFKWTICDVCNKPQDELRGTLYGQDHDQSVLWTCDECKNQGFNV